MIRFSKLKGILLNLQQCLGYLRGVALTEREVFLADPTRVGAAKYYLQVAIEACLNLGTHIISVEKFRAPRDYRDVFTVLHENGVLPHDLTASLRQMIYFVKYQGFRP